mgnify:CR=1 FL=1
MGWKEFCSDVAIVLLIFLATFSFVFVFIWPALSRHIREDDEDRRK